MFKPTAGESGLLQSADNVLIFPHRFPDQIGAIVLDHRDDRSLIDAEVIGVEPTDAAYDFAVARCYVEVERWIE